MTLGSGQGAAAVDVDTRCENGGCDSLEQVEASVSIDAHGHADAAIEILQYRVDYDLVGVAEQVPYYASETNLTVSADTAATLTVNAAGERQREWIIARFGFDQLQGTATLTLAGYDQDDNVKQAEAEFAIRFGDLEDGSGGGDAGQDGGTP